MKKKQKQLKQWNSLGVGEQSIYIKKARYLIDGGYASEQPEEKLAEQIYRSKKVIDKPTTLL
jgi:hypothetical protein